MVAIIKDIVTIKPLPILILPSSTSPFTITIMLISIAIAATVSTTTFSSRQVTAPLIVAVNTKTSLVN